jgi:hypothetical protein
LREGWQDVLDRRGVQWVIYPTNSALVRQLAQAAEWHTVYADPVATVLIRSREGVR